MAVLAVDKVSGLKKKKKGKTSYLNLKVNAS